MPTAPMRVPARRARTSLSHADDISALSLAEVRERLARNERVLQTSLFSTSPTNSNSNMTTNGSSNMSRSLGSPSTFSPTSPSLSQSPPDPVRGRLLAVRDALRAREAELVAEGMGAMSLDSSGGDAGMGQLSRSPPTRSGKARALDAIRLGEATRGTNGMVL